MTFRFEAWRLIVYSILAIMAGGCIGGLVAISVFERKSKLHSDIEQEEES